MELLGERASSSSSLPKAFVSTLSFLIVHPAEDLLLQSFLIVHPDSNGPIACPRRVGSSNVAIRLVTDTNH